MRILYIVHQFMPEFSGGTERVALNLARSAQASGHAVEVVTVRTEPVPGAPHVSDAVVDGVPVFAFTEPAVRQGLTELGFSPDSALRARFQAFLDARPAFDVAHVVHAFRMGEAVESLIDGRLPYVVTLTDFYTICHRINLMRVSGEPCAGPAGGEACARHCAVPGLLDSAYGERLQRTAAFLRKAAAVVAVSDYVAGRFRAELPDLKILVVNNGIDLLRFGRPPARAKGPVQSPLVFGYLGTVSEAKGAPLLARAFAQAAPADAELRIIGPAYEAATETALRAAAQEARIRLEGAVPAADIPDRLAQFDVLCIPSQVPESYSLALYEGFASGLPALVSDLGNIAEEVGRHGCGRVLPAADVQAWAEAIADLAGDRSPLETWRERLPLPFRVEEEGFLYMQLYRAAAAA